MKKIFLGRSTGFVVSSLALTLLAVGTGFSPDETKGHAHHEKQGGMAEQLRLLDGPEFERQFLSKMIQHHKDGVEAASMAVQKAQKPEIRQLAERNVDQQKKDIEQMTGWLQSWYQDSPKQPSPNDPMFKKAMMTRTEGIGTSARTRV